MIPAQIPAPGAHGGDGDRLARALGLERAEVLDLSQSLNPFAPDAAAFVAAHLDAARTYPDPGPATAVLAATLGVDVDRVLLTNGGAEAIALVAAELPVGCVEDPEFSLYGRHLRDRAPDAPRWRSNPNNPTGRLAHPGETAAVWDEAFYPLATGQWSRGDDALIVGSLTKVFACPGLRIGYVVAPEPETIQRLRSRQPMWSVSTVACAVLPDLIAAAELPEWATAIRRARDDLTAVLRAYALGPEPSDANFLLVRRAPGLRAHLARRAVLVRDTASFGITDGVRIAVPDSTRLDRLVDALKGYR